MTTKELYTKDVESTEHAGDIEDISDGERTSSSESRTRPTYYPGNNDDDTPGEFMVNAMDAEELRQSVRRSKRWTSDAVRLELPPPAASLSGSGHDSDDDDVSTPSGDNTERNPLSGSCESLDTVARREKYLKSAFDSLTADADNTAGNTSSISSQHLSRVPPPARPSPAPRTPSKVVDPDAARKRDELNRRILETRRQLENVAFRSNLKSSQSTTDLSYIPEKDGSRRARPVSMAVPTNRTYVSLSTGAQEESSSEAEEGEQRPRAASIDNRRAGRSGSERDLSAKAREVTARLTAGARPRPKPDASPEHNLSSSQLCSALTEQLTKSASKVVQLYTSLQREPNAAADISGLEAAIMETQKVLRGAVARSQNGGEAPSSLSSTDGDCPRLGAHSTREKLDTMLAKDGNVNISAMSLIDQYSDILLNMMQNKMVNQFNQSPQSLPPTTKEPGGDS